MDISVVTFLKKISPDLQMQVSSFVDGLKSDASQLVQSKANDMEEYLKQLAKNQISTEDLKMYMDQIQREIQNQAALEALVAKERMLAVAEKISSLIIQQLIQALVKCI